MFVLPRGSSETVSNQPVLGGYIRAWVEVKAIITNSGATRQKLRWIEGAKFLKVVMRRPLKRKKVRALFHF